eukprot:scaffold212267_cov28-Tisochrysis_lutea.AAC.1
MQSVTCMQGPQKQGNSIGPVRTLRSVTNSRYISMFRSKREEAHRQTKGGADPTAILRTKSLASWSSDANKAKSARRAHA